MNMEAMNRLVLAVIVCLALGLYALMLAEGIREFGLRLLRRKFGKKRSEHRRARDSTSSKSLGPKAIRVERKRTHDPSRSK